jgi:hypothetical protein
MKRSIPVGSSAGSWEERRDTPGVLLELIAKRLQSGLSPGDYFDWWQQNVSFSEMGAYTKILQGFNLSGDSEPQRIQ